MLLLFHDWVTSWPIRCQSPSCVPLWQQGEVGLELIPTCSQDTIIEVLFAHAGRVRREVACRLSKTETSEDRVAWSASGSQIAGGRCVPQQRCFNVVCILPVYAQTGNKEKAQNKQQSS